MIELLPSLVFVPLIGAIVATVAPRRGPVPLLVGLLTAGTTGALVVAATASVATGGTQRVALAGWQAPLGIELRADELSVVMLGLTALVGVAVTVYATGSEEARGGAMFWPLWLVLWASLNTVYLTADLFNTYVAFELMSVAGVSLVAIGGSAAVSPALRYLFVTVLGSLAYLIAVALIYGQAGTLDIELAAGSIPAGPVGAAVVALVTVGMALKTALFPLHSWLPPAHSAAPAVVSPVLSALVVKASFYVLLRVWFTVFETEPGTTLQMLLGGLGAIAVFWGGALALRQERIKRIVAYSTVAQVGYFFLIFPLVTPGVFDEATQAERDAAAAAWSGGIAFLLAHGVAKAAMFLAAGTLAKAYGTDRISAMAGAVSLRPASVAVFALATVSLAGLPPTFGFVGKWQLLQASLASGQWWWIPVLLFGGLLSFAYGARVVRSTFHPAEPQGAVDTHPVPVRMEVAAVTLAVLAVALGLGSLPLLTFLEAGLPIGGAP